MLSKLDAVVIASLSLGGGAMVENSHRVDVEEPAIVEVALVEDPAPAPQFTFCASSGVDGEALFTQYIASVGDALAANTGRWCEEDR